MIASTIPQTTLPAAPWGERIGVVALVVAVHAGLVLAWMMQPEPPAVPVSEMSVSVVVQQAAVAQPQAQPEPPKPQPRVERVEKPAPKPPVQEEAKAAPQPVAAPPVAATPVQAAPPVVAAAPVTDTASDITASYLSNPKPPYPKAALNREMEGKVILLVEILADGTCGEVSVSRSSGYAILDRAAIKGVKKWLFNPARRAGKPVATQKEIPVNFRIEGEEE
ncbi:MAG: TonB family protein [Gallionella sp.]|jgi:protein TonB|nr:TonB family protein [Gallionella sp.]MCK9353176.1 TonB family protein [Gallionella sp.]